MVLTARDVAGRVDSAVMRFLESNRKSELPLGVGQLLYDLGQIVGRGLADPPPAKTAAAGTPAPPMPDLGFCKNIVDSVGWSPEGLVTDAIRAALRLERSALPAIRGALDWLEREGVLVRARGPAGDDPDDVLWQLSPLPPGGKAPSR